MPLDLNYLPGILKKTEKTPGRLHCHCSQKGLIDPDLKPGIEATIQDALLMAKAEQGGDGARSNLTYRRNYLANLFNEN